MKALYHRIRLWMLSSLRRRLLLWLLPATFFAGVLASIGTYWGAFIELSNLFNDQMRYIAEHVSVDDNNRVALNTNKQKRPVDDDKADEVLFQIWHAGKLTFTTNPELKLPPPLHAGINDIVVGDQTWHTFVDQRGDQLIRVAQAQDARWEALAGLAVHLFWPVLSLLPILALFLWFGIGYGLKPLHRVAGELVKRNANSMEPVGIESLPNEIKPVINALNDLLQRLEQAFTIQKHFVADAAHELRTPVMALSLQAQLAQRADTDSERERALSQVQVGVTRLTHLIQQLLTLARLEPEAQVGVFQPVELSALCKSVILDQIRLAEIKQIDLGFVTQEKAAILGDPNMLRILLNNLVDNAIRYTPEYGVIDISVYRDEQSVRLEVCDNGPGIPKAECTRVLERFYRGSNQNIQGSGLGLSIVKRIAERHGAQVELDTGLEKTGLCIRIIFPNTPEVL